MQVFVVYNREVLECEKDVAMRVPLFRDVLSLGTDTATNVITLPDIRAFDKDPLQLLLSVLLCNEERGIILENHMDILKVIRAADYLMLDSVVEEFAARLNVPACRISNTVAVTSVRKLIRDRCRCVHMYMHSVCLALFGCVYSWCRMALKVRSFGVVCCICGGDMFGAFPSIQPVTPLLKTACCEKICHEACLNTVVDCPLCGASYFPLDCAFCLEPIMVVGSYHQTFQVQKPCRYLPMCSFNTSSLLVQTLHMFYLQSTCVH